MGVCVIMYSRILYSHSNYTLVVRLVFSLVMVEGSSEEVRIKCTTGLRPSMVECSRLKHVKRVETHVTTERPSNFNWNYPHKCGIFSRL